MLAGSFSGSVAGSVHEDLVAGVDEPVQEGLGDHGVGKQRVPVNWNWLTFLGGCMAFELRTLAAGAPA